jgi:site-specific DNA recombinase
MTLAKVAIYIRVSTQEQVENYSIETQKERLEAYCKAKGWSIFNTYIDPGYSGSNLNRPGLSRLLQDLESFDTVVVYKLDRLSRSQRDTLTLIEDHFLKNNIDFVSITETLDTSTPFGKAMIGILSVFAQLERETIAERMRMGHIKRAQEGYRGMGGDYDPAGYSRMNGALVVNDEEANHIKAAFNYYEQYHSITKVQAQLKQEGYEVWRFRRYRDILANRLYCGYVSFAGKHYKGVHKAIISEEQFNRVQTLLSRHKGKNANKAKESLLSGLLHCGKCGENYLTYQTNDKGKIYRYYICKARRFPSEFEEKCHNKIWNYKKLEKLIVNEINNLSIEKSYSDRPSNKIDYDKLIQKVDKKMERILGLYADGKFDSALLDKQMNSLDAEKKQLVENKLKQSKDTQSQITKEQIDKYVLDLNAAEFSQRQSIVQSLISSITIHGESIEIEWNF